MNRQDVTPAITGHGNQKDQMIEELCDLTIPFGLLVGKIAKMDCFDARNAKDSQHAEKMRAFKKETIAKLNNMAQDFQTIAENLSDI